MGYVRQIHVTPDPARLLSYGFSLDDVVDALAENNQNVSAGYIERNGQQLLVRVPNQAQDIAAIETIVLDRRDGVPIRIRDVATVSDGQELRTGAATQNGEEVVLGTVFMLIGENSRAVARAAAARVAEIQKSLPKGVLIQAVYDRTSLVDRTIATVRTSLIEGALLVIAVLFLLLGNMRAALITAAVIPLSMLMTVTGMVRGGVSGNLMSLGALDFGLIVDGAVIIVENALRRFGEEQARLGRILQREERFELAARATAEVIRPSLFGIGIITAVYLPIFALTGIEGKMFHPMAITVVLALTSAMVLSLTFVPAAVALFLGGKIPEHENRVMREDPHALRACIAMVARASRGLSWVAPSCSWRCRDFWRRGSARSSFRASMKATSRCTRCAYRERASPSRCTCSTCWRSGLRSFRRSSACSAESARQRWRTIRCRHRWPIPSSWSSRAKTGPDPRKSKRELVAELETVARSVPGNNYEFTQPIQMRMNELISGVRADVAIKVNGDDLETSESPGGARCRHCARRAGRRGCSRRGNDRPADARRESRSPGALALWSQSA